MQQHHFLPVNWADGMKINQSHFIAQDNATIYQIAQNTSSLLHDCNYGLLPGVGNGETGMKLFLSVDNQQQVQLRVQQQSFGPPAPAFCTFPGAEGKGFLLLRHPVC
jgi:hypothetical protein